MGNKAFEKRVIEAMDTTEVAFIPRARAQVRAAGTCEPASSPNVLAHYDTPVGVEMSKSHRCTLTQDFAFIMSA
jgi:hypothetical protein